MKLLWDIYFAVPKYGSLKLDQYKYTERLLEAATEKTDKTLFLELRFLKATTLFVVFIFNFFMIWSVLLCSRTRCASISLVTYLDSLRLFVLPCLTVCDHIIVSCISLG